MIDVRRRRARAGALSTLLTAGLAATMIFAAPGAATAVDQPDASAATTTDIVVSARVAYAHAPVADPDDPAYLAGTTFELFATAGPGDAGGPGAATGYGCTIAAGDLDCTIEVPDTGIGGVNEGRRFHVVTTDAGDAAYPLARLQTGTSSDPANTRHYPGLTSPLVAGETIDFPEQGAGETLNSGVIASGLNNPAVLPACAPERAAEPLSLAVQFDLSSSVTEVQGKAYAAAFENLVTELEGMRVELSLMTFGSSSPVVAGRESGPWSLDDPADVDAVLADIAAFTTRVPGPPTQFTNWDLALRHVADQDGAFDQLLILTDGAPNYVSNASGTGGVPVSGSLVTIAALEQAVFSANAVKAEGTRISAIGIGNGATGDAAVNLAAISGPVAGSDYFESDWSTIADDLRTAASVVDCTLPVTVTKNVLDRTGATSTPADGWSFTLATSDVTSGTATIDGDNPQLTGSGANDPGQASWAVEFSDSQASATVSVTETPQPGHSLVEAVYTVTHLDGSTTTGAGSSTTLDVPGLLPSDSLAVTFTNAPTVAAFQLRGMLSGDAAALVPSDATMTVGYSVNGVPAVEPLRLRMNGTPVDGPALVVGDEVTFEAGALPEIAGVTWAPIGSIAPIVLAEPMTVVDVPLVATATPVTPTPTPTPAPGSLVKTGAGVDAWPAMLGLGALVAGLVLVMAA
ncbi:vWA domain-containing protein, partial [Microbacterium caowuchunii]|uniref:vWA domain-containing protein n=1 Tax=Microbacterium caowuchunii TaxID=2614638 RepID=UPI00177B8D08